MSDLRETLRGIGPEVDIVIGTQLVAKGHHFPGLALVGVVDADLASQADPARRRATFQLLNQVTGRAGRDAVPGRGLIQTYMPEHPVIAALASGRPRRVPRARDRSPQIGAACRLSAASPRCL